MKLPIVPPPANCDDCGACCMEQTSPPGYAWLLARSSGQSAWRPDPADVARVGALPEEPRRVLVQ